MSHIEYAPKIINLSCLANKYQYHVFYEEAKFDGKGSSCVLLYLTLKKNHFQPVIPPRNRCYHKGVSSHSINNSKPKDHCILKYNNTIFMAPGDP